MGAIEKVLDQILKGRADTNIAFRDLRQLLLRLGFQERTSGGHHIFRRKDIRELINLQKEGGKAKRTRCGRFGVLF
jgi:predicted RNA binding protein YcfA (HicA-like mRNA interferase family)